ncbi:MAG: peroxiredoxin [Bacteroidetes bacterium]|uniref:peroxiredoxin n=1 Tax=Flavobacterium sp. TaxID=239 RepID=UPI002FDA0766|nr:peroxiredoxin [Bacteroidota bacterium]
MALQIGDIVPNFTAKDNYGNDFDSKDYLGKKTLVIYFYPKNDTRVCTEQACSFRDNYEDFKALGAEVIGVSSDTIDSHQQFSEKHKLPFILLSDSSKKLRKLFGVPNDLLGLIPGRVTYFVDKNGMLLLVFNSMSGKIHIEKALEILKRM